MSTASVILTPEQQAHLDNLKYTFNNLVDYKYRRGVLEHGGNLWTKPDNLFQALMEAIDLFVYIATEMAVKDGQFEKPKE